MIRQVLATLPSSSASYIANVRVKVRNLTAAEYKDSIDRHILPHFIGRRVRAITSKDIEDFGTWLIKRGKEGVLAAGQSEKGRKFGLAIVNKLLTLTSMVFGYAVCHNWAAGNPAHTSKSKAGRSARERRRRRSVGEQRSSAFTCCSARAVAARPPHRS